MTECGQVPRMAVRLPSRQLAERASVGGDYDIAIEPFSRGFRDVLSTLSFSQSTSGGYSDKFGKKLGHPVRQNLFLTP